VSAEALDGGTEGGGDGSFVGEIDAAEEQMVGRAVDEDGVRPDALEGASGGGAEVA